MQNPNLIVIESKKRSAPKRLELTTPGLSHMPIPGTGESPIRWHDTVCAGLVAVSNPGGSITFFLRRTYKGKPLKVRLGEFPELTVDEVRKMAADAIAKIDRGELVTSAMNGLLTVAEIFDKYKQYLLHTRSAENTFWYWEKHCAERWGHSTLNRIRTIEIQEWVNEIGKKSGGPTANRALIVLQAAINWAQKTGVVESTRNPCRGVTKFKQQPRMRFLDPAGEFEQFVAGLNEHASPDLRDFCLLCLYTAQRKSNVMEMSWRELSDDFSRWTIPANKFKTGTAHVVPLSSMAQRVLRKRWEMTKGKSQWVFPNRRSKTGHMTSPGKSFTKLLKKLGIKDLTIHDLRRTTASLMAISGESLLTIGQALGHKDPRSTHIYAKLSLSAVERAFNAVHPDAIHE